MRFVFLEGQLPSYGVMAKDVILACNRRHRFRRRHLPAPCSGEGPTSVYAIEHGRPHDHRATWPSRRGVKTASSRRTRPLSTTCDERTKENGTKSDYTPVEVDRDAGASPSTTSACMTSPKLRARPSPCTHGSGQPRAMWPKTWATSSSTALTSAVLHRRKDERFPRLRPKSLNGKSVKHRHLRACPPLRARSPGRAERRTKLERPQSSGASVPGKRRRRP